jgi:hypothetical protein
MTLLEELLKEQELHDKSWNKYYEEDKRLKDLIATERNCLVIESNLLSQPIWSLVNNDKTVEFEQFEGKDLDFWEDFEKLCGEHGYHWRYEVVIDDVKVICDDGDIYLLIRKDRLKEYVDRFKLKIVADKKDINRIKNKILSLEISLKNIEYIGSLGDNYV